MKICKSGIYIIKCSKSIKVYIGSATNIEARWKLHLKQLIDCKHHLFKFQNGYNKYGKENFTFEILELVEDKTKLIEREQYYLDTLVFASENNYKFNQLAYNICRIAGSQLGNLRSKKSKNKSAASALIKWKDKEYAHKINKNKKGRKCSDMHRANISKSLIGHTRNTGRIYGKKSRKLKKQISNTLKNKKSIQCYHCNRFFKIWNYARWHGNNCKLNINKQKIAA